MDPLPCQQIGSRIHMQGFSGLRMAIDFDIYGMMQKAESSMLLR